ncbi:retinol dehydrogenase 13-like isoform X2 [Bacillus rossius redtenbacheri]|uniref:retinol dehydrogenase 13-like isoform X2 n=1 Tax=Bacillus rossius redtenbacheri TaxID=93214 RepID=UPI002FDE2FCA
MDLPSYISPFDSWAPYIISLLIVIITCVRHYMGGPECPSNNRIDGKIVIVTGATSGLGLHTATELAKRGGTVVLACRDLAKGIKACEDISQQTPRAAVSAIHLDTSSLQSVRKFSQSVEFSHVDILINNAGIAFHPPEKTEDGIEMHLATNYLGHFLLTHLLLPKLKAAPNARVINVSAHAHYGGSVQIDNLNLDGGYSSGRAFSQSKLAMVLMARHMAHSVLAGTNVTFNVVDPGIVRGTKHMRLSPLSSSIMVQMAMMPWLWLFMKSCSQGAQTIIYLAVARELARTSGTYYSDCAQREPSELARDSSLALQLYEKSCSLVGIECPQESL